MINMRNHWTFLQVAIDDAMTLRSRLRSSTSNTGKLVTRNTSTWTVIKGSVSGQ